jgi:uncharacterized repeat protein (TIGR03803 family)
MNRLSRALVTLAVYSAALTCSLLTVAIAPHAAFAAPTETRLYGFGGPDGGFPYSPLLNVKGVFYGTTTAGGATFGAGRQGRVRHDSSGGFIGYGAVFAVAQQGSGYAESLLYSFLGPPADGAFPYAAVILDKNGVFYGTTTEGGVNGLGTVFKLTPNGSGYTETVLYNFTGSKKGDGSFPYAGLLMDKSGVLYGATQTGGSKQCSGGCGTIFKLTPTGSGYKESVIHTFLVKNDGQYPYGTLIADASGALYGTTYYGGTGGLGTVFKLTPTGSTYTETTLHNFSGPDGAQSTAGLTAGKNGVLYGTTNAGGTGVCYNGCGVVFSLTPNGSSYTETVLYNFQGGNDGFFPYGGVTLGKKGVIYGSTFYGGAPCKSPGCGTIFELTPNGSGYAESSVYSFQGGADGSFPGAPPLLYKKKLFGTTYAGGGGACFQDQDTCGSVYTATL